jgi:hypothetical protein
MRSLTKTAAVLTGGCFILAFIILAPTIVQGDEWNLKTRFMVNQSSEIPGLVLQPNTRYVIQLLDSPSTRNVVQVYNDDESQMLTMFMGISDQRLEPADKTVFSFIETQPGYPLPIKEWFYPGRLTGLEFVYPKDQAMEIARHAREPILAASGSLHDLKSITVESIGPLGAPFPAAETATAANTTKVENPPVAEEKPSVAENPPAVQEPAVQEENKQEVEQPAQIAQNDQSQSTLKTEPEEQREKPAEPPAATEELPQTAGELPLIALIGVLCLGAGLGMKVLSRS